MKLLVSDMESCYKKISKISNVSFVFKIPRKKN